MFGLLDSGPLSSPDAQIALAAGLLSGTGNVGANLSKGLLGAVQAGQQERANRQNDLQQLSGAYQMLKQQEFAKMLAARQSGQPYSPNPMLPQMEQRLAQLTGLPNLAGQGPTASRVPTPAPIQQSPAAAGMPPAPPLPGMAPPSSSPMADPNYQPPMVRPPQAQMPQQPQPSQPPQDGLGGPAGGQPMEAWLAMDPSGKSYMEQLAKDNQPVALRQGDLVGRGPNGSYHSLFQQPQMVPGVIPQRDANGQVIAAREVPGFSGAAANVAGTKTTAEEAAKSQFKAVPIPGANRLAFISDLKNGQNPLSLPQLGSQGAPQGPGVAQVTTLQPSKQSQYFGGFQGNGLSGPDPVALAGATADAKAGATGRQKVMIDDYQSLAGQNASAQTIISRLQTIKQLGPQAITGAESEKRDLFNGLLSLLPAPLNKGATDAKTAGDLVDKNAAQIALAIGAGSNGTDALRSLAQIANPSRHMTLEGMQKASDSLIAPLQMTLAKTQLLTPHFSKGDTASYLAQKQAFEQGADPRIFELQALPPDQQKAYVSSLSAQDAKQLLQKRAILKQLGVIQ